MGFSGKSKSWFSYLHLFAVSLIVGVFIPLACSQKPEPKKTNGDSPSPPDSGNLFECGTNHCDSTHEFCTAQRFTSGGQIIKSECHHLSKIEGKDNCDSARAGVPADLKDLGSFCYDSYGRITLNFVTPDLLPLEDKVTDALSAGSLTIKFHDVALVEKLNSANSSYNAPVVESGRLTANPKEIYCRILANNGFVQRDMPYAFSVATTKDRMIAGSRKLTFEAGTAGPFSLSGECIRQGDTSPFTVPDLRAIFGTLAVFGP